MSEEITPHELCRLADGRVIHVRDTRGLSLAHLEHERVLVLIALDELVGDVRHSCANRWLAILDQAAGELGEKIARAEFARRAHLERLDEIAASHLRCADLVRQAARKIAAAPALSTLDADGLLEEINRNTDTLRVLKRPE